MVIGPSATAALGSIDVENGGSLTDNGAISGAPSLSSLTVGAGGTATLNSTLSSPTAAWSVAGTLRSCVHRTLTIATDTPSQLVKHSGKP